MKTQYKSLFPNTLGVKKVVKYALNHLALDLIKHGDFAIRSASRSPKVKPHGGGVV